VPCAGGTPRLHSREGSVAFYGTPSLIDSCAVEPRENDMLSHIFYTRFCRIFYGLKDRTAGLNAVLSD
jgi:hypothetical protein